MVSQLNQGGGKVAEELTLNRSCLSVTQSCPACFRRLSANRMIF